MAACRLTSRAARPGRPRRRCQASRAVWVRASMSAILNWIAWNAPIGLPERLALLGVPHRLVHAALGQPGGQRGDRDPALVEGLQELGEARGRARRAGWPAGTRTSSKLELVGVRRAPADLGVSRLDGEAGRAGRHEDGRDLLAPVDLAGDRGHRDDRGDVGAGVGDEGLAAVDDPLVGLLVEHGPGRRAAGVRAEPRLGQPERGQRLAGDQPGQPGAAAAPRCRSGRSASRRARPPPRA